MTSPPPTPRRKPGDDGHLFPKWVRDLMEAEAQRREETRERWRRWFGIDDEEEG